MRSSQIDKFLQIFTGEAAESPRVEPGGDRGRSLWKYSEAMAWMDLISCLQGITALLLRIPSYMAIKISYIFFCSRDTVPSSYISPS